MHNGDHHKSAALYGDIPGSKPDWRGANIKGKGKAAPEAVPLSHLGETGWAAWTFSQDPRSGWGRRHYHHSPLAQTVAKDCLPCVDPNSAAAGSTSSSNLELSSSIAAANRQQRRHRRMIATPPEKHRPQGKRTVAQPAAACQALLQDPPQPSPAIAAAATTTAAAGSLGGRTSSSRNSSRRAAEPAGNLDQATAAPAAAAGSREAVSTSFKPTALPAPAEPEIPALTTRSDTHTKGPFRVNTSSSSSRGGAAQQDAAAAVDAETTVAVAAAAMRGGAGDLAAKRTGVPFRVEDDPDYFRALKDPPAFQRFCASLKPALRGNGRSTAARHELGLQARQRAAVEQARREVVALQAVDPSMGD